MLFRTHCALLLISFIGLSGCAQMFGVQTPEATLVDIPAASDVPVQALVMPGDKRAILVRRAGKDQDHTLMCAEPAPDIGLSTLSQASANLSAAADAVGGVTKPDLKAEIASTLSTSALALAGRDRTVLLTRDLLYRLCEASLNYSPDSKQFEQMMVKFDGVLVAIKDLAAAEKAAAAAQEIKAQTQQSQVDAQLSAEAWAGAPPFIESAATKIATIITKVSDGDKLDAAKLQALVKSSPALDAHEQKLLLGQKTKAGLEHQLWRLSDDKLEQLFQTASKM